jgi:hypothetical protein
VTAVLILLAGAGVGMLYNRLHRVTTPAAVSVGEAAGVDALVKSLPAVDPQVAATQVAPPAAADASALAQAHPSLDPNKVVTPEDGQCALFTTEEFSRMLDTTLTHADADATGCTYLGDAPRLWVRTEATWTGGRKLTKAKSDTYKSLRQSMVNQHYSRADVDAHVFPMMPLAGVGDEAWVNLWNVVTARKGDVGVTMDLRYYHDSEELTRTLTNTALSRLRLKKPDATSKAGETSP